MKNHSLTEIWPLWKKLFFRLFCAFVVLYIFPFPLSNIPGLDFISRTYNLLWDTLVPWSGDKILHLPEPVVNKPSGSGDTTFDYLKMGWFFTLTLFLTLIWSLIDTKRKSYNKVLEWLTVLVRYYLAMMMLNYGFYKVIQLQFPFPSLRSMLIPFGETSPMGLAWKFMGYSGPYNLFTGLGEVIGGALLFLRRTTTLGAAILIAVISNIVMINFSYDVPVKLFSSTLLIFAIFLLILDGKRLLDLFILNKATEAKQYRPHFDNKKVQLGAKVLKGIFIVYLFGLNINNVISSQKQYGKKRPLPPLYGIYEVETFVKNGDTIPALLGDSMRWRRLIVEWPGRATFQAMDEKMNSYTFNVDTTLSKIEFYPRRDTILKSNLGYRWANDSTQFFVEGISRGDTLQVVFKPYDPTNFLLVNRGFHWINETPYNR